MSCKWHRVLSHSLDDDAAIALSVIGSRHSGDMTAKARLQHGPTGALCLAQDISVAEAEAAKKKVGSAAAVKQLEKLRKEAAKTSKDAEQTAAELASRKEEHKVSDLT